MSWNAGKTGSNTTPLGPRKRMNGDVSQDPDDIRPRGRSIEVVDRPSYNDHDATTASINTFRNESVPTKKEGMLCLNSTAVSDRIASNHPMFFFVDGTEEPRRKR